MPLKYFVCFIMVLVFLYKSQNYILLVKVFSSFFLHFEQKKREKVQPDLACFSLYRQNMVYSFLVLYSLLYYGAFCVFYSIIIISLRLFYLSILEFLLYNPIFHLVLPSLYMNQQKRVEIFFSFFVFSERKKFLY